jgi:hypothetical protein
LPFITLPLTIITLPLQYILLYILTYCITAGNV